MDVHCEDGDQDLIVYGDQVISNEECDKNHVQQVNENPN